MASSASFATTEGIECPKIKLVCSHSVLSNKSHNFEISSTQEAPLTGINDDEPSLPNNECEASISFKSATQDQKTLGANLQGEKSNQLLAYLYIVEPTGAAIPQFSMEVALNQSFNLHYNQEQMTCKLVDSTPSKNKSNK
jgi:hypothetical protein